MKTKILLAILIIMSVVGIWVPTRVVTRVVEKWLLGLPPLRWERFREGEVKMINVGKRNVNVQEIKIVLHKRGEALELNNRSPYFFELLCECERFFRTYDGFASVIYYGDMERVKQEQVSLEVIYPDMGMSRPGRGMSGAIVIKKLLIPLTGKNEVGFIYYYINYVENQEKDKDFVPFWFNVINYEAQDRLKQILEKLLKEMGIKMDWERHIWIRWLIRGWKGFLWELYINPGKRVLLGILIVSIVTLGLMKCEVIKEVLFKKRYTLEILRKIFKSRRQEK